MSGQILLTNDDGYDAPGLRVLCELARQWGTPRVVAPLHPHSQLSHKVTLSGPVSVVLREQPGLACIQAVDGTPADCVRLAATVLRDPPCDWVFSGINAGANIGIDIYYSGTVAAAREACIHGMRGIALSQYVVRGREPDWDAAQLMARRAIEHILAQPWVPGTFWTVTMPVRDGGYDRAPIVDVPMSIDPLPMVFEEDPAGANNEPGRRTFRNTGRYAERLRTPGTDVEAVFNGCIAATRLRLDASA